MSFELWSPQRQCCVCVTVSKNRTQAIRRCSRETYTNTAELTGRPTYCRKVEVHNGDKLQHPHFASVFTGKCMVHSVIFLFLGGGNYPPPSCSRKWRPCEAGYSIVRPRRCKYVLLRIRPELALCVYLTTLKRCGGIRSLLFKHSCFSFSQFWTNLFITI